MRKLIIVLLGMAMTLPLCGAFSAQADVYPVIIVSSDHGHRHHRFDREPPRRPHFSEQRHHFRGPPPPPHYGPRHEPRRWHGAPAPHHPHRGYQNWR